MKKVERKADLVEKWRDTDNAIIKNAMEIRDRALQLSLEDQKFFLGVMYGLEAKEPKTEKGA